MIFQLTEDEHRELVQKYKRAATTPVIYINTGQSLADSAWNEVRYFMDALGRKYGYDPKTAQISMDSREFNAEQVK